MLSTPATRLEQLYLPLQLPTPLLSPIMSSQQQVGGDPPQHTHMCVATCKPPINFQRRFTISVKLSFQVFFPANIWIISLPWPGSPSGSPRVYLYLPRGVQGLKHTIQRIFCFFPSPFGSKKVFSPPRFSYHSLYLILVFTVQLQQYIFTLMSQQHYSIAPGSLI